MDGAGVEIHGGKGEQANGTTPCRSKVCPVVYIHCIYICDNNLNPVVRVAVYVGGIIHTRVYHIVEGAKRRDCTKWLCSVGCQLQHNTSREAMYLVQRERYT